MIDTRVSLVVIIIFVLGLIITTIALYKFTNVNVPYENVSTHHSPSDKKILVYQSGAYHTLPNYAQLSIAINKLYCDKWGYDYKFFRHPVNKMPPYWLRVFDLRALLNHDYDYIVYLDLDAIFYDQNRSIESVIENVGDYDIYVGKDIHPYRYVNSGAYIVKNSPFSHQFVNEWCNVYTSTVHKDWVFDKNTLQWKCEDCEWAGPSYEQGQMELLTHSHLQHIAVLPHEYMSNINPLKKSFILHLMWGSNAYRELVFKNILQKM